MYLQEQIMSSNPQNSPISFIALHRKGAQLRHSPSAFSLVEMVISLGIVSFAMLGIFGMIPVGLSNFRTAQQLTVESSIVQGIASELQRTDAANLVSESLYFDEQGRAVAGSGDSMLTYTVNVSAPQDLDADNLVSKDAARSVLVSVRHRAHPGVTNSYSLIVPRGL